MLTGIPNGSETILTTENLGYLGQKPKVNVRVRESDKVTPSLLHFHQHQLCVSHLQVNTHNKHVNSVPLR